MNSCHARRSLWAHGLVRLRYFRDLQSEDVLLENSDDEEA